jgi:hypothetical protein
MRAIKRQTTMIAEQQRDVQMVALDDTHAYWIRYEADAGPGGRQVVRAALGSGKKVEILAAVDKASCMGVNDSFVVIGSEFGELQKIPKTGGAISAFGGAYKGHTGGTGVKFLVVDGTDVFWATRSNIFKSTVSGDAVPILATPSTIEAIAVDAGFVYFADRGVTTRIMKVARSGGEASVVVGSATEELAAAAGEVFWLGEAVLKASIGDGKARWVSSMFDAGKLPKVDGDRLVWVAIDGIFSTPTAGGMPTLLYDVGSRSTHLHQIQHMAVRNGPVVWAGRYDGAVRSLSIR